MHRYILVLLSVHVLLCACTLVYLFGNKALLGGQVE